MQALRACRSGIVGIAISGVLINVLYLSGSLYMLEVYDRVLTSRSIPTLIGLSVLVAILYAFQGCLDLLRSRVLVRIGRSLGESLSGRVYADDRPDCAFDPRRRRRTAAAARSRPGARLPVEPRAGRAARSAVDAVLHSSSASCSISGSA